MDESYLAWLWRSVKRICTSWYKDPEVEIFFGIVVVVGGLLGVGISDSWVVLAPSLPVGVFLITHGQWRRSESWKKFWRERHKLVLEDKSKGSE